MNQNPWRGFAALHVKRRFRERWKLSDMVQIFDTETSTWQTVGRLPYLMKSIAAYYDGWLYVVTGQCSKNTIDPTPGQVLNSVWRAKFSL